jgi:hypothetical protein
MKNFIKLSIIPIIVFICLVSIPTFFLNHDVWDGVLIEYAADIGKYEGLKNWFTESTWYLMYPFLLFIIKISDLLSISYKNINIFITLSIMILILYETYLLCKNFLHMSNGVISFVLLCMVTFPPWTSLLSSALTFHLSCIFSGMIGLRYIRQSDLMAKVVGFVFIIFAFSLQSQFIFIPIFSYFYDLIDNKNINKYIRPSLITIAILFLSCFLYLILKLFFPATGIYAGYQSLIIFQLNGLLPFILRGLNFITYLLPLAFVTFLFTICLLSLNNEIKIVAQKDNHFKLNKTLLWALMLFCAGAFPYMAVGKSSIYWEVNDWVGRQAFLLCMPISILSGLLVSIPSSYVQISLKKSLLFFGALLISINTIMLIYGNLSKYNRQHLFNGIEEVLRSNSDKIPPGLVQIIVSQPLQTVIEFYEPNYIMYKATGQSFWFLKIDEKIDKNFTLPCFFKGNDIYHQLFIYKKPDSNNLMQTIIELDINGFSGLTSMIKNTLSLKGSGTVQLSAIEKSLSRNLNECP